MSARTLVEDTNQYRKALEEVLSGSNPDEGVAVDILKTLLAMKVDKDLLAKTKIGVVVNKLAKHSNTEISSLARDTVKAWKEQTLAAPSPSPPARTAPSVSTAPASSPNSAAAAPPAPKPALTVETSSAAAPKPHSMQSPVAANVTQGWDMKVGGTGEKLRNTVQTRFFEALNVHLQGDEKVSAREELAVRIENALFAKYKSCNHADYKQQYQDILFNLKDKTNPDLTGALYSGELQAEAVVNMKNADLASKEMKRQRQVDKKDAIEAARSDWLQDKGPSSDMFKCGKCKQSKTRYYQMQTRSADEPMTTFITCLTCGNRWKIN